MSQLAFANKAKRLKSPFLKGVSTELHQLIKLRYGSKDIELFDQRKRLSAFSGLLTSRFKGRGIDFAEVRQYQPGDDIRTIDWRVTARTQRPHTKLFQEERERPVLILLDQSKSLGFGSQVAFKSVLAAEAASLIAWSALDHGERVGGLVFNDESHQEIRPKRSQTTVLRLLNVINEYNQKLIQTETNNNTQVTQSVGLAGGLQYLRRVTRPGSQVIIISDFFSLDETCERHINQLSTHNDLVAFFVYDNLEQHLPIPDYYTLSDGEKRLTINTSDKSTRNIYQQRFNHHTEKIHGLMSKLRVPMIPLTTAYSVASTIQQAVRKSRKR